MDDDDDDEALQRECDASAPIQLRGSSFSNKSREIWRIKSFDSISHTSEFDPVAIALDGLYLAGHPAQSDRELRCFNCSARENLSSWRDFKHDEMCSQTRKLKNISIREDADKRLETTRNDETESKRRIDELSKENQSLRNHSKNVEHQLSSKTQESLSKNEIINELTNKNNILLIKNSRLEEELEKARSELSRKDAEMQSMQREINAMNKEKECKVCLDRQIGVGFLPCGHECCCVLCAGPSLRKCPVCRGKIQSSFKTYLS